MKTDLKYMKSFLAVAEEGSFTAAARRLHIAQPPLSMRIKEIEEELQVGLFLRSTRSVELTEAGRVLYREMSRIVADYQRAILMCKNAGDTFQGILKIGYTGRASDSLLPQLLYTLRAGYPDVRIELAGPLTSGELETLLLQDELDMALCFLPVKSPGIATFGMRTCQLALVVPDGHPFATKPEVNLTQLATEAFVGYPSRQGFFLHDAMLRVCKDYGFTPNIVQESPSSQALLCLVAARTGVAILPGELERLAIKGVTFKRIVSRSNRFEYGLAWVKTRKNDLLHAVLAQVTSL